MAEVSKIWSVDQLICDGFRYALDPMRGGLVRDCDPEVEYEWMRLTWSASSRFRLTDMPAEMNLWGLFYRQATNEREGG